MEKITESTSKYRHLEQMSVPELLRSINQEDQTVPLAVEKAIPQITALVEAVVPKMREGGRLFYIGAGTSGTGPTWEDLAFAVMLGAVGLWSARRLLLVRRDVSRGAVAFIDGPVHVDVVLGRFRTDYALVVGGARFPLPRSDAALVPALQEGVPCRLYHAPASRSFVAVEPLA